MKIKKLNALFITCLIILSFFLITSCSKRQEKAKGEKMIANSSKLKGYSFSANSPQTKKEEKISKRGLKTHFIASFIKARERLLEYHVQMTYECENLLKSRQELLGITSKYGYIKHSQSTTEGSHIKMRADIYVKSDSLYMCLNELNKVGILLSETISVIDHTEDMAFNEIKIKREQIRIIRRNRAFNQSNLKGKTWKDRDNSLERSEDELDKREYEQWKIRDRISWAKINLHLKYSFFIGK